MPGVDLIRIKEDETNCCGPTPGMERGLEASLPLPLERRDVCEAQRRRLSCCQSYMLDGEPVGRIGDRPLKEIFDGETMRLMRRLHADGVPATLRSARSAARRFRIPCWWPGSLLFHGPDGAESAALGGTVGLFGKLPRRWLKPPKPPSKGGGTDSVLGGSKGRGSVQIRAGKSVWRRAGRNPAAAWRAWGKWVHQATFVRK